MITLLVAYKWVLHFLYKSSWIPASIKIWRACWWRPLHSYFQWKFPSLSLAVSLTFPKCWIPGRGFWISYLAFAGFLPWILHSYSGPGPSVWSQLPNEKISLRTTTCLTPKHGPPWSPWCAFPRPWEGLVFAFSELDMSWIHLALASWATPPLASFLTRWHAWSQLLSPCLGFPRKNLYSQWFAFWILTIAPFLLLHVASF